MTIPTDLKGLEDVQLAMLTAVTFPNSPRADELVEELKMAIMPVSRVVDEGVTEPGWAAAVPGPDTMTWDHEMHGACTEMGFHAIWVYGDTLRIAVMRAALLHHGHYIGD